MSLKRNNEEYPIFPISRENVKKRIQNYQNGQSSKVMNDPIPQSTAIPELSEIENWAVQLTQEMAENSEEAKRDERVMLMTTSVIKMCRLLRSFSEIMSGEMAKIKESQLQTLNIQKQYAENVQTSIAETARDMYGTFLDEQKKAFEKERKYLSETNELLEKSVYKYAEIIKNTAKSAARAAERLRRIENIGDLLYFAAPILVLIDIILRIIQ